MNVNIKLKKKHNQNILNRRLKQRSQANHKYSFYLQQDLKQKNKEQTIFNRKSI